MLLDQIYIYPIKSARGITVNQIALEARGPAYDRRWMLVDDDGVFLSQRRVKQLALVTPRLDGDALFVDAPGMPSLCIRHHAEETDRISVRIWDDVLSLPHPSPRYSEWFSACLQESCRLVYLPPSVQRPIEPPFDHANWSVSLSDGFPVLVISQASLDLLNSKLPTPLEMNRFRPNLVISGCAPHAEDKWKRLRIGSVELAIVKPCARCSIVLIDQQTGQTGVEPLRTLASYRKREGKIMFGQNALATRTGLLQSGLIVEVLE